MNPNLQHLSKEELLVLLKQNKCDLEAYKQEVDRKIRDIMDQIAETNRLIAEQRSTPTTPRSQ